MRIALSVLATALLALPGAAEPNTLSRVAFARDGNIVVRDLREGTEVMVTADGAPAGPGSTSYGCPTFVDPSIILFVSWTFDEVGEVEGCRLHAGLATQTAQVTTWEDVVQPFGLGALPHDQVMFLEMDDESERSELLGARLHVSIINADGHILPTDITTSYGGARLDRARLRTSADGRLLVLPHFPTDVSSWYGVWDLANDRELSLVPGELAGLAFVTGIDMVESGAYGTILVLGEGTSMPSGLYRLDLANLAHELIVPLPEAAGVSVDEGEGIAVVGTIAGKLHLVDLQSGDVTELANGVDPDLSPHPLMELVNEG